MLYVVLSTKNTHPLDRVSDYDDQSIRPFYSDTYWCVINIMFSELITYYVAVMLARRVREKALDFDSSAFRSALLSVSFNQIEWNPHSSMSFIFQLALGKYARAQREARPQKDEMKIDGRAEEEGWKDQKFAGEQSDVQWTEW